MLALPGATVANVTFAPEGVVVELRRRRRRLRCPCGFSTRAVYDRRVRRWRHLDLGGTRLWLSAPVARLFCRRCRRVRTEVVPWARPAARHTRDFQDVVAYLAQRTDKTTITRLLRVSWEAVAAIVAVVVAEHLDDARLDRLYRIGVDEVSYRTGHRYLTVVADHDREDAVVWVGEGKDHSVLERFYDELGPDRRAALQAVSLDMGGAYKRATDTKVPHARQCVDPFHVIKAANAAIDRTRRELWNAQRRRPLPRRPPGRPRRDGPVPLPDPARQVKHTRWALVKDPAALTDSQLAVLTELYRRRSVLFRCWQLKEALRDLYRSHRASAASHLDWWLSWACRSRIPAFVALSRTLRANRMRILAAVELGLSNSRLEGLNSKIRLINHRGFGHHSAAALTAMIYLCAGGVTVTLPLR
jgi:transposase